MRLIRYGKAGQEKPGIILNNKRYDVSEFVTDYNEDFFGKNRLADLAAYVEKNSQNLLEISSEERLGAPVRRPGKIICIGLNFRDHAIESNAPIPSEPIVFFKATSAISGPNDDVIIPKNSTKTDWEVELAFVIGKKASYVDEAGAEQYIAGYLLHNDYSERAFQLERGGQWVKGKSCDTFAPLGPELVTSDEISDVNNLDMWLTVNGKFMQKSNTKEMIFKVPFLVHYLSQFMTLEPGDVVTTGTPAGVGLGFKPPIYLNPGDVVELGIEGLGSSKQTLKAFS